MANSPIARGSGAALGPKTSGIAITPHASATFTPTRGLICSGAGTVAVRFADDAADVSLTLAASVVYDVAIIAVRVTGTTATGLVALY